MINKGINKILKIKFKSSVFLYPLLNIDKNTQYKPEGSYMGVKTNKGEYKYEDSILILKYKIIEDIEYFAFEKNVLKANENYIGYIKINNKYRAYMFDLENKKQDFINVSTGRYSKLSEETKRKILNHNKSNPANVRYLKSYMYPEKYFNTYAKILTVTEKDIPIMESLLSEVGELCDPPNLEKEILNVKKESKLIIQL